MIGWQFQHWPKSQQYWPKILACFKLLEIFQKPFPACSDSSNIFTPKKKCAAVLYIDKLTYQCGHYYCSSQTLPCWNFDHRWPLSECLAYLEMKCQMASFLTKLKEVSLKIKITINQTNTTSYILFFIRWTLNNQVVANFFPILIICPLS